MTNKKYLLLPILFLVAFVERVYLDLGPNVELVTAAMILSAFYIGGKSSLWLTLAIMVTSDIVLGNSRIFLFTWTGFAIPIFFISKAGSKKVSAMIKTFRGTLVGMSSTAFFFLWTNFGVWLLSNIYSKDIFGLLQSYINALPFLRYQAISTLLFVPLGFMIIETLINLNNKYHFSGLPQRQAA